MAKALVTKTVVRTETHPDTLLSPASGTGDKPYIRQFSQNEKCLLLDGASAGSVWGLKDAKQRDTISGTAQFSPDGNRLITDKRDPSYFDWLF